MKRMNMTASLPPQKNVLAVSSADDLFKQRMHLLRRFVRDFVWAHLGAMLGAGGAMLLFAATVTALPWLFENLVDQVFVKRVPGALNELIVLVVVLFSARALASFLQQYLLARVANKMSTAVQTRFADHVLSLDLSFFHRHQTGQIVARGTEDVNVLNQSMTNLLVVSVRDLVSLLGLIAYVVYSSPQWFALTLIGGPLIAIPTVLATRKIRRLARQGQELNGDLIGAFEECFHAIRGIKAEANEPVEQKRLAQTIRIRRSVRFKIARTQALLMPVVDLVTAFALVAVLLVGGASVMAGTTEPGKLMAFIGALMLLYDPLKRLLQMNSLLQTCLAAIARIYQVLDERPAIAESADSMPLEIPSGDITFEHVSFGYEAGIPLLKDVSFTIPAGSLVGFVGASGSGKTTLLNLLARLNEPDTGRIFINKQDLSGVKLRSLRSHLALVAQDALLFDSSIRDNIAYGMPEATNEQIRAAAVLADADSFITSLADGYNCGVGPRGSRMSGGQRQRVVIARALLRNSAILMLDEATSALDGETESRVLHNIVRERAGRTTIMIAHRLSTVIHADYIGFIEEGRLVEWGNHTELMAIGGAYARAVSLQSGITSPLK
jgi:subfamily B ATP-binding cassette protein MsbA